MDNENKNKIRSSLNESTKQAIKQTWNIDVDSEILSPLVDYIFKRIFTADDTNSKQALINFINSILEHENDDIIVDLTIINSQIPVDRGVQKKSIFDIRSKYNNGRQCIIEMQKESTPDFTKRSIHTISKAYVSQPISGRDFNALEKCYLICITNFDMIKETSEHLKDYRYRDRQGNDLSDAKTIIFLDLSKLGDILDKSVDEMTNVEMWAIFFKYVTDESKQDILNEILERKEGVKMARNILIEVSKDEEARAYYESELIFELDQRGKINQAKREGREEVKIELAKNLLDVLDIETIAMKFKMPVAEVEALK
ncbi:MAG: Rpn family recombination-promoting nuclease/putative transposase [Oscillospiraceae bacterium]|nr:Rpn family recombination-promoting nuclease/putative transposase [Oscillospiraceae bacterium]